MVVVPSPEDQNMITLWPSTGSNNPENLNIQQYPCEDIKYRVNTVSLGHANINFL